MCGSGRCRVLSECGVTELDQLLCSNNLRSSSIPANNGVQSQIVHFTAMPTPPFACSTNTRVMRFVPRHPSENLTDCSRREWLDIVSVQAVGRVRHMLREIRAVFHSVNRHSITVLAQWRCSLRGSSLDSVAALRRLACVDSSTA